MPSAAATRLASAGICISGEHPPEMIMPSCEASSPGTFQRHLRGPRRHLASRGVCRLGSGARILVARLAQIVQRQRGAPLDDADPVLNPFHVHPNVQR